MKLTKQNIRDIRLLSKDMERSCSRLELGERWVATGDLCHSTYFNRLHRLDDESDLSDTISISDIGNIDFEMIDGKLLLDFYQYSKDGSLGNMLIMLGDKNDIIGAYSTSYTEGLSWDLDVILNKEPKVKRPRKKEHESFDKVKAEAHLNMLLKKYKIKVWKWSSTSSGRARIESKSIKIPKPTNIDKFAVCMHEVGHIYEGRLRPTYLMEYKADMFALDQLKLLGFDTQAWEHRTRWHILMQLAKANNRGVNWNKVPKEIIEFVREDVSGWAGKRVFVEHGETKHTVTISEKQAKEDEYAYDNYMLNENHSYVD